MLGEMKTEIPDHQSSTKDKCRVKERLLLRSDSFGLGHFVASNHLYVNVGDLVQIDRVLYTDWALYVGDANVVHLCNSACENEIPTDFAVVSLSNLNEVASYSGVRVNNKIVGAKERNLDPLPVEDVVQTVSDLVGKTVEFNMLTKNSEHYVTEWKYGRGWSDQAAITMNVMRTLSADSTVGHSVLVNSLNAVLNSPGSPISRSPPRFTPATNADEEIART